MHSTGTQGSLVLGRYRLGSRVGVGASGSVFRAQDAKTDQDVVIKFFDAGEDGFSPWANEMRLVMRFKHPNIVPCLDVGFDDAHKLWVLVFAQARGGSLRRWLAASRKLSLYQTAQVLIDVGSALSYAHEQGVVHRDVKPDKITPV